MDYVYLVQFDWSTEDDANVETSVYRHYKDAYKKYKQLIKNEMNPLYSWVAEEVFYEDGSVQKDYFCEKRGNPRRKEDLCWHVGAYYDVTRYSRITLTKKEIL